PLGETKEFIVDVKYDVGNLEITKAAADNIVSFDLQYDQRRYEPKFTFDAGDRATMHFDMNRREGFNPGRGNDNDLTLRLSDKVPIDLTVASGVSESHLDLTGIQLRRMHLKGG